MAEMLMSSGELGHRLTVRHLHSGLVLLPGLLLLPAAPRLPALGLGSHHAAVKTREQLVLEGVGHKGRPAPEGRGVETVWRLEVSPPSSASP